MSTDWKARLQHLIRQHPLLETGSSLKGIELGSGRRPEAVYLGVGLCSRDEVSQAVPLDLLGMLLPAAEIRRAVAAEQLIVLIADSHALTNNLEGREVARQAQRVVDFLQQVRALGLDLEVLRASELQQRQDYAEALEQVRRQAQPGEHDYVLLEAADAAWMKARHGSVLKAGWSVSANLPLWRRHDELAFDHRIARWVGDIPFAYAKAGRRLDQRQPKACPYLVLNTEARICLQPGEGISRKLTRAARWHPPATVRGVRNHLKAITRSAMQQLNLPLRGSVEQRGQQLLQLLLKSRDGRADSLACPQHPSGRELPWLSAGDSTQIFQVVQWRSCLS